jgi:hypothetical protein
LILLVVGGFTIPWRNASGWLAPYKNKNKWPHTIVRVYPNPYQRILEELM